MTIQIIYQRSLGEDEAEFGFQPSKDGPMKKKQKEMRRESKKRSPCNGIAPNMILVV